VINADRASPHAPNSVERRAAVVGETTRGGAHPGDVIAPQCRCASDTR